RGGAGGKRARGRLYWWGAPRAGFSGAGWSSAGRARRKSRAPMSVFDKHRDTLEHHETMMGSARGRLAVAMDLLTDSLALVGQHGVYCRSERFPGKPRMDIALVLEQLDDVKQLVQSAMEELRPRA